MKISVYTFAEDTDSGTDSRVFGTEAERDAHLKQVMLDSYNRDAENPVVTVEPDGKWTTQDDGEQDTITLLNSGDICGAFLEWNENSPYRRALDTYNVDDEEIEVPNTCGIAAHSHHENIAREFLKLFGPYVDNDEAIPGTFAVDRIVEFVQAMRREPLPVSVPATDALVAALQLARRTLTDDPNDYEWIEHHMMTKARILKQIDAALSGVPSDHPAVALLREVYTSSHKEEWVNEGCSIIYDDLVSKVGAFIAELDETKPSTHTEA